MSGIALSELAYNGEPRLASGRPIAANPRAFWRRSVPGWGQSAPRARSPLLGPQPSGSQPEPKPRRATFDSARGPVEYEGSYDCWPWRGLHGRNLLAHDC